MKLTTVGRGVVSLLLTLWFISIAIAQGDDKNTPEVLEMAPMQQGTFGLPPLVPGTYETVETACDKYAKGSVEHNDWQLKQNCGYKGSAWSSDYQQHYKWCVQGDNLKSTSREFRKRQEAIAKCICDPYAKNAVAQNSDNIALGCGYSGPRWSSVFAHHYNWCARGGGNIIESGNWNVFKADRDNDLAKCKNNFCDNYAKASIAQDKENKTKNCGFSGPKWSSDYNQHFKWCLGHWKSTAAEIKSRKIALSQNCKPKPPPPPPPPPPPTGGINGTFFFDGSLGSQSFNITVIFEGAFIAGSGTSGKKSFSVTKTKKMYPSAIATVSFSEAGLAKGKWNISASSNMTGSVTCQASVPGFVKLNVIGGPSCN